MLVYCCLRVIVFWLVVAKKKKKKKIKKIIIVECPSLGFGAPVFWEGEYHCGVLPQLSGG